MILAPSSTAGVDVEYTFAQVGIEEAALAGAVSVLGGDLLNPAASRPTATTPARPSSR